MLKSALPPALLVTFFFAAAVALEAEEKPKSSPPPAAKPEKKERKGTKWDAMDVGPFFSSGLAGKHQTLKALTIKVATNAAVCFDTELLRMSAGWTGGFLLLPTGRDGLEGIPEPVGVSTFATPRGPGWAKDGSFADPRPAAPEEPKGKPVGPMPKDWAHWRGVYLHGSDTVLSYSVGAAGVLELPGFSNQSGLPIFTRSFQVDGVKADLELLMNETAGAKGQADGNMATLTKENPGDGPEVIVAAFLGKTKGAWTVTPDGQMRLKVSKPGKDAKFQVAIWSGAKADLPKFQQAVKSLPSSPDLKSLTKGGPARWTTPVVTKGKLGTDDGPYTVDTLTLPDDNPWKSWLRMSGFDFFKGGARAAICSVSGDVWIVDGIDDKLENLRWKRFATGLFQPLGLKIVDEKIYITGRDQITRLHDLNGDGEADFYENFNNDLCISSHYHEFVMGLETDSKGNFYFTKGGDLGKARHPHHGALLRLSKDGSDLEVFCNGLRAPNGLGMGPGDVITTADNEGNWVPSSRVDICKPGRFNGHVFTSHTKEPPTSYDPPLFWLPHTYELDNSSGGQVWVTSDKWGPFKGDMLHTSYGACSLFHVMQQEVDGVAQAGCVKFPLKFETGIMRGRFNERDGQLYLAGLVVWQSKGPRQGGFQRVRYTGRPVRMPAAMQVKANGIEVKFTDAMDEASAQDLQNYSLDQWNYKWTKNYGSKDYSVADPEKQGRDKVEVKSAKLGVDRRTVFLEIPGLQPVMQMRIKFGLKTADGTPVSLEIYNTINRVPSS